MGPGRELPAWLAVAASAVFAACSGSSRSSAPLPTSTNTNDPSNAPGATIVLELPIDAADSARSAFGLNPFGVHIGDHGADGHPGYDLETRLGASARCAADGVVQSVNPDPSAPGKFIVQVQHGSRFRTSYVNVERLAAGVVAGASVKTGQTLGIVGSQTRTIGSKSVTYAMIHFQLDDFTSSSGQTNRNAVNPGDFMSASAKASLDAIFQTAVWSQELCEPFLANPRDVTYPLARTWTLSKGTGPFARLDFSRPDATTIVFDYRAYDQGGALLETGKATLDTSGSPATIDLTPTGGAPRRGVYDVVATVLRLDLGAPGSPRPTSLASAAELTTK